MNTVVERITTSLQQLNTWQQRARMRRTLLRWNDRKLEDMGFSRRLLAQGAQAWPWKETADTMLSLNEALTLNQTSAIPEAEIARAVAELKALSNDELFDLGLQRGDIAYAVRYGHPGNDDGNWLRAA